MQKTNIESIIGGFWFTAALFVFMFIDGYFAQLSFDVWLRLIGLYVVLWVPFTLMCALILCGVDTLVKTDLQRRNKKRRK